MTLSQTIYEKARLTPGAIAELKRARDMARADKYAWKPRLAVMLLEVADELIGAAERDSLGEHYGE